MTSETEKKSVDDNSKQSSKDENTELLLDIDDLSEEAIKIKSSKDSTSPKPQLGIRG